MSFTAKTASLALLFVALAGAPALADEAPLHIRKTDHDRVDLAAIDGRTQIFKRQCARHARFLGFAVQLR